MKDRIIRLINTFLKKAIDILAHYGGGNTITTLFIYILSAWHIDNLISGSIGLIVAIAVGYAKEKFDVSQGRPFSQKDFVSTIIGGVTPLTIIMIEKGIM